MLRRAKLALFAVLGIALAISSLVYANSTSVETGGNQYLPKLILTGGQNSITIPTLGLKDNNSVIWSATGAGSGTYLKCSSQTAICTMNASYFAIGGGAPTLYYNGVYSDSGNARLNLSQQQSSLDTTFSTTTPANGQAFLMGTTVADATAGVAGTTLLNVGTGVSPGTGNSAGNGTVAVSKFLVNGAGTSTFTAANNVNAIALATNGSRVDLGTGSSDYFISDGTGITTPTSITATTFYGTSSASVTGQQADGPTAVGVITSTTTTYSNAGAKLLSVRNNTLEKSYFDKDGFLFSPTLQTVTSAYVNGLLAVGTVYAGHKVAAAFVVSSVSLYVSTPSTATAANQIITITDGTNTCTATFACNTVTNTTGVKDVGTANGAGSGCAYAASALLTFSTTTQGCGTAATVKNIDIVGYWGAPPP